MMKLMINPYEQPNPGSLIDCMQIAEAEGCEFLGGGWNDCCAIVVESRSQYIKVKALLEVFEISICHEVGAL